jgi:hypothetical protein
MSRYATGRLGVPGFLVGSAIDLSMVAGGIYSVDRNGNAGSGALLATGIVFVLLDAAIFWSSHGGSGEQGPWTLDEPVAAHWRGERIPLDAGDIVVNGVPRPSFSVAAVRARLEPQSTSDLLCLRAAPLPRINTTVVLFDAVPVTNRLREETVRYLSDVVRARAAQVAPDVHVLSREELIAAFGGREVSEQCNVTCRLEIASGLGATVSATAEVNSDGETISYFLAARSVKTGEVLATVRAYGKNLDELDRAVRPIPDRLFGCRQ